MEREREGGGRHVERRRSVSMTTTQSGLSIAMSLCVPFLVVFVCFLVSYLRPEDSVTRGPPASHACRHEKGVGGREEVDKGPQ